MQVNLVLIVHLPICGPNAELQALAEMSARDWKFSLPMVLAAKRGVTCS